MPAPYAAPSGAVGAIVLVEDLIAGVFEFLELPGHHGPDEDAADQQHQDDGQRDQQVQRFHQPFGTRLARNALPTTASELAAMPAAATAGDT